MFFGGGGGAYHWNFTVYIGDYGSHKCFQM